MEAQFLFLGRFRPSWYQRYVSVSKIGGGASASRAFWFVAAAIAVVVLGANTPVPLFTVYQQAWHFSTGTLTVVYGIYTVGVIAAVFAIAPLSDVVGRKRVLVPAVATMIAGLLACMFAVDVPMLIVGRLLQGIAIGAGVTTAVAALGELHPLGRAHEQVALVATVATVVGLAGGPLVAGVLAQYAPWPTIVPYLASLVLTGLALIGVLAAPETVQPKADATFRLRGIGVPRAIRGPFLLATYVEMTAYAVAGTFAGLGASFTRDLLHVESHLAAGLLVALLFLASTTSQLAFRALDLRRSMIAGLATLAVGLVMLLVAIDIGSAPLFFLATVVLGAGHGLAYLGAQELTDRIAPSDARAKVFAAFQLGLYVGATAPALLVGYAAAAVGFRTATVGFILVVLALALAGLVNLFRGESAGSTV